MATDPNISSKLPVCSPTEINWLNVEGNTYSLLNKSVKVSPEKTPFLIFSKASTTIVFVVVDFAISILSIKSTPAWFKFPNTIDTSELSTEKDIELTFSSQRSLVLPKGRLAVD